MSTQGSTARARMQRVAGEHDEFVVTPSVITGAYVMLGLGALFLSDYVFPVLFTDPLLMQSQAVKGAVEVLVTGGIIYLLATRGHRQIAASRDRIKRQREELAVLHRVMRHNLRNDMNVIQGRADLVEESAEDETLSAHCDEIKRTVDETLGYAEKTSRIRRVSEVGRTTVDLSTQLPAVVEQHPRVDDSVSVEIDLSEDTQVVVNQLFTEAFAELLTNAISHTETTPVEIQVRAFPDPDRKGFVAIEVTDNGPGMQEADSRVINDGREGQLLHLDGLGLWFAYWTVVEGGGEMRIEAAATGGTTVRLSVPAA